LILGFNGIDYNECAELETLPMFFVVAIADKDKQKVTQTPKLAGDFFDATSPARNNNNEKINLITTRLYALDCYIGINNIGNEEDGKTNVTFFYEKGSSSNSDNIYTSLQNGQMPFEVEVLVNNKTIKPNPTYYYGEGGFKLIFNTREVPDKIYIISKDNQKIAFDGKTRSVI